jgi:hypothetical protein
LSRVTGSGTTNLLAKFTGSTAIGNSIIRDDGTNIGIGATSQGARLEILRSAAGSGATNSDTKGSTYGSLHASGGGDSTYGLAFRHNASAFTGISGSNFIAQIISSTINSNALEMFTTGNSPLVFGTSATERMRIFANGRVGIGTGSTDAGDYRLQIAGSIYNTTGAVLAATSGNVGIGLTNPGNKLHVNGGVVIGEGGATAKVGIINMVTTGDGYLTIDAIHQGTAYRAIALNPVDGNVGVGLTAPTERLHVNGRARIATIDSSASPINMLWADVDGVVRKTAPAVQGSGTTNRVSKFTASGTIGNGGIVDETTSEVMRITTANNVGIATTTPAEKLDVNGRIRVQTVDSSGTAPHALYVNSVGTITRGAFPAAGITGSGTANRSAKFTASGAIGNGGIVDEVSSEVMRITTANNVGIATTTPAEKLDVNGRIRVQQVDSSGTAPHVLYVNSVGTITKGAFQSGGGTVTSVATGFGIDGGTITSTGTLAADTVEIATRARVQKGIDSVAGLARVTGSGTANYFPYWTGTTALGNSEMYQLNSEVLIGYTADQGTHKLQVNGNTFTNGSIKTAAPSGGTAAEWKLGTRVASSVTLDGTQYIEVDIGGTLYYLATVSFLEPKPKPNP